MKPNTLTGDPYVNQILDFCHGHTGGQGDYHFHAAPECLIQHPDGSEEHYNIVGFALDGYPLIAHYKSVLDASGNPVLDADGETQFDWLETSGYEPDSAYKTQVLEGGEISTYAWDNYGYDAGRLDRTLDEGNGRILTDNIIKGGLSERAFFNFGYGYFITGEFPYFIAKYRGEINIQNRIARPEGPEGERLPRPEGLGGERSNELDEKEKPVTKPKLAGDVNSDNSVNIFDLVMVAGQFGKSGAGLSGDVNGDSSVNIFDLVMVAGNFGKSVAAAPTVLARELTFTTQQKLSVQSAIVELKDMPMRSEAEELVLSLLIAILPERLPEQTQLLPNYPNPFNPETWIPFELNQDSDVSLAIYDMAGRLVRRLDIGFQKAGTYLQRDRAIYWDGRTQSGEQVASGTYFYTLKTEGYVSTQKMIILK